MRKRVSKTRKIRGKRSRVKGGGSLTESRTVSVPSVVKTEQEAALPQPVKVAETEEISAIEPPSLRAKERRFVGGTAYVTARGVEILVRYYVGDPCFGNNLHYLDMFHGFCCYKINKEKKQ